MKIDKKFIGIVVIVILAISIIVVYSKIVNDETKIENNITVKTYQGENYYIYEKEYDKEYDLQLIESREDYENNPEKYDDFQIHEVLSYEEYEDYCDVWNLKQKYKDTKKNYIVFSYIDNAGFLEKAALGGVFYEDNKATLYVWDSTGVLGGGYFAYTIIVPTNEDVEKVEIKGMITEEEYNNMKDNGRHQDEYTVKKPVIYLYPDKTTDIKVKLLNESNITTSYPKYNNEWLVRANPNGDLIDIKTNKKLYALYYESNVDEEYKIEEDGFVVKGNDISSFLEDKLTILGLNDKEKEEFIIYWLPMLENNKYNYIRFATREEIDNKIPIDIKPNPDTFIRIIMTYKGLDKPISVKEQKLNKTIRTGYTVVEWGGKLIK